MGRVNTFWILGPSTIIIFHEAETRKALDLLSESELLQFHIPDNGKHGLLRGKGKHILNIRTVDNIDISWLLGHIFSINVFEGFFDFDQQSFFVEAYLLYIRPTLHLEFQDQARRAWFLVLHILNEIIA